MVGGSIFSSCKWSKFTGQLSTPYMRLQNSKGLVSLDMWVRIPLGNQKTKNILSNFTLNVDTNLNLLSQNLTGESNLLFKIKGFNREKSACAKLKLKKIWCLQLVFSWSFVKILPFIKKNKNSYSHLYLNGIESISLHSRCMYMFSCNILLSIN